MRAARWPLILFSMSACALLGLRFRTPGPGGMEDPSHPDRGVLGAVTASPPDRIEVARVAPDWGGIVDVAAHGQAIAVLTSHGWQLNTGDTVLTWMGSRTAGSPDWIGHLTAVALDPARLSVLDEGRSVISVWNRSGRRTETIPIPFESTYAQRPTQLLLDSDGFPLVTRQRVEAEGEASWDLLSFDSTGAARTIISLPGETRSMVFDEPLLALNGSVLLTLSPLTHELARVDLKESTVTPLTVRADPPLWIVPQRHRKDYRRMLRGLGGTAARLAELPEYWPSVRDFTIRWDGKLLVAVTAGENRQHIEVLSSDARPLERFSLNGYTEPVFLSQGRVFLAEEGTEETVIYELVHHGG